MPRKSKRVLIIGEYNQDPEFSLFIKGPVTLEVVRGHDAQFVIYIDPIENYSEEDFKFLKLSLAKAYMGSVELNGKKVPLAVDQRILSHELLIAGGIEFLGVGWTGIKWFK